MAEIKPWEKGLPRPPRKAQVVRSIVLRHVRWSEMRQISQILQDVVDDYGNVTERTVFRHLACLIKAGVVRRVFDEEDGVSGYVLAAKPRWNDVEQACVYG